MSGYLLDTHVLLWWLFNDARLSYNARQIIRDPDNRLYLSAASSWEIATKHRMGKLPEAATIVEQLPALLIRSRINSIDITLEDALLAGSLKNDHRDPFDRMIIAQAKLRELPIVTSDKAFKSMTSDLRW